MYCWNKFQGKVSFLYFVSLLRKDSYMRRKWSDIYRLIEAGVQILYDSILMTAQIRTNLHTDAAAFRFSADDNDGF